MIVVDACAGGKFFGNNDQGLIAHLSRYAEPELAEKLAASTRIDDDHYDWQLNDVQP